MSAGEQAAGLVFPGFKFGFDDPSDAERLADLGAGGFCLYGGQAAEVRATTERLQRGRTLPLLFAGDYEDGLAAHVAGGTPLPSNMGIGASGDEALAFRKGEITARESLALGVRWVFAPVVDLATRPGNPIVNIRAFGDDPALVERLARAYLRGLRAGGALSCLKHFPGHGESASDSHLELPTLTVPAKTLAARELAPFKALCGEADAVMTAHLKINAWDKAHPATLSAAAGRVLRDELGFTGLVSTDALNMLAIADRYQELDAALLALNAGADVLLVPRRARELIFTLMDAADADSALGLLAARAHERVSRARQAAAPAPAFETVGSAEHRREAAAMAEACLAWADGKAAPALAGRVGYLEPGAGPDEWKGAAFLEELRAHGVHAEPAGAATETLLVACFVTPRAYSGRISLDARALKAAKTALSKAKRAVVVAFGSPFVLPQLTPAAGRLCAFSAGEPAQRAAARALAGKIAARGVMPVALDGGK